MGKLNINPVMVKLTFTNFKKWHKKHYPNDTMTAEERYLEIGGALPKKPKKQGE
jgi:hypothetical protein